MLEPGAYLLLFYDYVADVLERRDPYRAGHLAHATAAKERGELVAIGAVGAPPTGAILVFRGDVAPDVLEAYAAADPYAAAGLITGHRIAPWTVVG